MDINTSNIKFVTISINYICIVESIMLKEKKQKNA